MYGHIWSPTLWSYRQIRNKCLSHGCWDLTTTKRSFPALPLCRNTTMLWGQRLFSPGLHTRRNETAIKATQRNERPRWGGSRRYQLPHIFCGWKPVEESLVAGTQPTRSLPVTLLQNWCNGVTMANGDANNHYRRHIPLYRHVSNPVGHYIQQVLYILGKHSIRIMLSLARSVLLI